MYLRSGYASLEVRVKRSPEAGADALVRLSADEDKRSITGVTSDLRDPLRDGILVSR